MRRPFEKLKSNLERTFFVLKKLLCVLAAFMVVFGLLCNNNLVEAGRGARPNETQVARQQKSKKAQNKERARQGMLSEAQKNRKSNKTTSKQDKMQARNLKRLQKSDDEIV